MMRECILVLFLSILSCACAGVSIKPIDSNRARQAHESPSEVSSGYLVYAPVVVVEITERDVCIAKNDKGGCDKQETRCSAGMPFVLPDYGKPYVVDVKSGLGKAGAELTIVDGWRLGAVKDSSDNTAVLSALEKLFGISADAAGPAHRKCKEPGLYRVEAIEGEIKLTELHLY